MKKEVYIIGAGTYGEVMFELAESLNYKVLGFYDDDSSKHGTFLFDVEILGKFSDLDMEKIKGNSYIIAIGNNCIRQSIVNKVRVGKGVLPSLIHPSATISKSVELSEGVYIHANVFLWTQVKVGTGTIISPNVVIAHHTKIDEFCLISTLSGVGANLVIGKRVFLGMGSTVMTGVKYLVDDVIIGAGSTVTKNIDVKGKYVGSPARSI